MSFPLNVWNRNIVGSIVRFANGTEAWGLFQNIETARPRATEHSIYVSIEKDGQWFSLARYWDPWYDTESPQQLAKSLGMHLDDIFPISYDVQPYVSVISPAHTGKIFKEPKERLPDEVVLNLED